MKLEQPADKPLYFLHINSVKENSETIKTILQISNGRVYIVPDQNSPENFEEIRKVYPNSLGKIIFNGPDAHPLAKYLRRNSRLYNFEMFGGEKTIPLGVFKVDKENVQYYSGNKLK